MTARRSLVRDVLVRIVLLAIVLAALFGLFVWYGTTGLGIDPQQSPPDSHDVLDDEPAGWEVTYMYAVSALAAVWVIGRALVHWRLDRRRLALVPRSRFDRTTTGDRSGPTGEDDG
ncbi:MULTISPECIES: hypothetical protein [Natrialbaceae]|uniref:hypothetical protein n=1 Tax=Natrialbaceae TaxID=1644061 RepID=UPI00207C3DD6|nr:hypothetical protein [Natronococcus sp. CG52]